MSQVSLPSPEIWRQILRATLRECSYLPDPVARNYMHKYVLDRYRKKLTATAPNKTTKCHHHPPLTEPLQDRRYAANFEKQKRLHKTARKFLSLLQRGNQGYQQPLSRILMLSYGRLGPKRHILLSRIVPHKLEGHPVFNSSAEIEQYLKDKNSELNQDDWQLPDVLRALLKAQRNNSFARSAHGNRFRANDVVTIPKLNSWRKPMPDCRVKNIRKRILRSSKYAALPPPDPSDVNILCGLVDGSEPWKPPVRRAKLTATTESSPLETLLSQGPKGDLSFNQKYSHGRPHRLTRRFMRTLWKQVYQLMPQEGINLKGQKKYTFPELKGRPMIISIEKDKLQSIFQAQ